MVHQHFMLVETLTVAENVTLGREPSPAGRLRASGTPRQRVPSWPSAIAARRHQGARSARSPVGAQQRVEILKALHHGARVLILDEPTAVLTPHEVDELFQVLRALKAEGATIVLITHKLNEVRAVADRVTVMRRGAVVGGGPVRERPARRSPS